MREQHSLIRAVLGSSESDHLLAPSQSHPIGPLLGGHNLGQVRYRLHFLLLLLFMPFASATSLPAQPHVLYYCMSLTRRLALRSGSLRSLFCGSRLCHRTISGLTVSAQNDAQILDTLSSSSYLTLYTYYSGLGWAVHVLSCAGKVRIHCKIPNNGDRLG